jgi:hypothetical protein
MTKVECVRIGGKPVPILEMWESFSGWYWFVTEQADPKDDDYVFGLVVGFETEAGYIDRRELIELTTTNKVWIVPKQNWFSNSHVELVEKSELQIKA